MTSIAILSCERWTKWRTTSNSESSGQASVSFGSFSRRYSVGNGASGTSSAGKWTARRPGEPSVKSTGSKGGGASPALVVSGRQCRGCHTGARSSPLAAMAAQPPSCLPFPARHRTAIDRVVLRSWHERPNPRPLPFLRRGKGSCSLPQNRGVQNKVLHCERVYPLPTPTVRKGAGGLGFFLLIAILLSACSTSATPTTGDGIAAADVSVAVTSRSWSRRGWRTTSMRRTSASSMCPTIRSISSVMCRGRCMPIGKIWSSSTPTPMGGWRGNRSAKRSSATSASSRRRSSSSMTATITARRRASPGRSGTPGHPNVRILNGGLAAWAAAGHAIERRTHTAPHVFYRDLPDESLLINRCDMLKATTDPQAVILDVRTDSEMTQTWGSTMTDWQHPERAPPAVDLIHPRAERARIPLPGRAARDAHQCRRNAGSALSQSTAHSATTPRCPSSP